MSGPNLPAITSSTLPALIEITEALGVPRTVLASDEEIQYAWRDIPRELSRIPPELRSELLARMCVAVATGLFDGAINYAWNASIVQLRNRVRSFGLNVVSQILGKPFDETILSELKDAELLSLSLQLNLISEEGFFFLDQCRDVRNNFSAAHPNMGLVDDRELITFLSRCAKYALSTTVNPRGVDINAFIAAVKGGRFTQAQLDTWLERLDSTHDAQRELLFGTLHGIYCDPGSSEESRINALLICQSSSKDFSPKTISDLIDRHYEYQAKGDTPRHTASQQYFENLGFLSLLNETERHAVLSAACKKMMSVHMAYDNFYNEPPFAQRLLELAPQSEMPESAKPEFVLTVLSCYIGNRYGVSRAAVPYYERMIRSFTPREIAIFLKLPGNRTILSQRISSYQKCNSRFRLAVQLLDPQSIPNVVKAEYKKWTS